MFFSCLKKSEHEKTAKLFTENIAKGKVKDAIKYATEQYGRLLNVATVMREFPEYPNFRFEMEKDSIVNNKAWITHTNFEGRREVISLVKIDSDWKVESTRPIEIDPYEFSLEGSWVLERISRIGNKKNDLAFNLYTSIEEGSVWSFHPNLSLFKSYKDNKSKGGRYTLNLAENKIYIYFTDLWEKETKRTLIIKQLSAKNLIVTDTSLNALIEFNRN